MKKSLLALLGLSTFTLTACTTVITNDEPVEKRSDIKHICVKEARKPRIANFGTHLANSLQKKGFTTEVVVDNVPTHCQFMLHYSLTPTKSGDLVNRAKVKLSEVKGNDRNELGEIGYKRRGDEKENAAKNGVQSQADRIINELFKNF